MGYFGNDSPAYDSYNSYDTKPKHEAHVTHELLGGAVAYEAAKAYEDHVAKNGKPDSHAKAKEIGAGLIGVIVDREFEKHGLNFIDKEKAKYEAKKHLDQAVSQDYQ